MPDAALDDPTKTSRPTSTEIVYVSREDDEEGEIHIRNLRTGEDKRLTNSKGQDTEPAWSPDGRRIAFASTRDGDREVFVMDADGENLVRVTDDEPLYDISSSGFPNYNPSDSHPSWFSSEGLVFLRVEGDAYTPLRFYKSTVGSAEIELLFDAKDSNQSIRSPEVSPDGRTILYSQFFVTDESGGYTTWTPRTMIAPLSNPGKARELLRDKNASRYHDMNAAWSRDGKWIALVLVDRQKSEGNRAEIGRVRADGSGYQTIYGPVAYIDRLSWSPDGKLILFSGFLTETERGSWMVSSNGGRLIRADDVFFDSDWRP